MSTNLVDSIYILKNKFCIFGVVFTWDEDLLKGVQKSGDKLNTILVGLELGDFADSNVNRHRNDARFHELSLKVYETNIQPVC